MFSFGSRDLVVVMLILVVKIGPTWGHIQLIEHNKTSHFMGFKFIVYVALYWQIIFVHECLWCVFILYKFACSLGHHSLI